MLFWKTTYWILCQLRSQLSKLKLPSQLAVYDTGFKASSRKDHYERHLVTQELEGYQLWCVSFSGLKPWQLRKVELFRRKLTAVLAARGGNENGIESVRVLLESTDISVLPDCSILDRLTLAVAEADGLDTFIQHECWWPGHLEYHTCYGRRCLDVNDPSLCSFEVTEAERLNSWEFASALFLPYKVVGDELAEGFPPGTLVVCVAPWDLDAQEAGYANALPF